MQGLLNIMINKLFLRIETYRLNAPNFFWGKGGGRAGCGLCMSGYFFLQRKILKWPYQTSLSLVLQNVVVHHFTDICNLTQNRVTAQSWCVPINRWKKLYDSYTKTKPCVNHFDGLQRHSWIKNFLGNLFQKVLLIENLSEKKKK